MALTYEWKLTGLRKQNTDTFTDVVVGTHWTVTATDEQGNTGTFTGATPFKPQDLNADGFIDYKDLTEELVLDWVKNTVAGNNVATNYWAHIYERIMEQINSKKYNRLDVSTNDLPWSPTSGSTAAPAISGSTPL
jgi:hypothetical protein